MDVYGQAVSDFYHFNLHDKLYLHNSYGPVEEMPVEYFFRPVEEMPDLEIFAMEMCKGRVLDIGAGVGSHALALQEMKLKVDALEISFFAAEVMRKRGVESVVNADVFTLGKNNYDTLLLLMNGIGLTGTLAKLEIFLDFALSLMHPGGQLLFDSSEIMYLYDEVEKPVGKYYGEIAYQYEYKGVKGEWFDWLYVDQKTLKGIAKRKGWYCKVMYEDEFGQYLARMWRK